MSDKTTMLYNLRLKCAPMQQPEGDKRYWYADHYGFSDNFGAPVVDNANGPYGPPQLETEGGGDTGRYAGSLLGTVARLQGYDVGSNVWRRVAVNGSGQLQVNVPDVVFVEVTVPTGSYTDSKVAVSTSTSTQIAAAVTQRTFLRVDAIGGNLWVRVNQTAALETGMLVTPSMPLIIEGVFAPDLGINAIAVSASTFASVTQRRLA